jgi:hypothetical protein
MKFSNLILRTVAVFVAVSIAQILAGAFVAILLPPRIALPAMPPHMTLWMMLSNAVTVAVLSILALKADWRGWTLGAAVAMIPLAVTLVDGIEGVYFLPNSPIEWSNIFAQTAIAAALSVPAWMLLFGRRPVNSQQNYHPLATKSWGERTWKLAVCDFSYLALYFTAGSIIWPYIKDFYAMQKLPSMSMILLLELLVRGPALILLCLMMTRMLGLPRLRGALAVGVIFTVLTGIAPLLIPNPYFPDLVRWAHFCEVTSSNFVFGAIVAWLWGPPARSAVLVPAAA